MNSLEEIALKVAQETDAHLGECVSRDSAIWAYENARRLVSALGAQQYPVALCVTEALRPDEYKRRTRIDWTTVPIDGPLFTAPVLPSAPEGWMPIDGMPDHVTSALLLHADGRILDADFRTEEDGEPAWVGAMCGLAYHAREWNFTHWMRRPAAPSPQEDKP